MESWMAKIDRQRVFTKVGITLTDKDFLKAAKDLEREAGREELRMLPLGRLEAIVGAYMRKWEVRQIKASRGHI
ncbi:MAG TPA: hypothetical protein VKK79_25670 [Candidatus Lokiarchaeia archaeon]|nr:hypothetical protein [Candidatus Lokiarchaeia archaeon]